MHVQHLCCANKILSESSSIMKNILSLNRGDTDVMTEIIRENRVKNISNRRIKIAFVLWSFDGMGGSERVVYDIIRKLNREIFEVLIIGFKDGEARNIFEKLEAKVVVISKMSKFDLSFISSLRNIFLENNVQIINAHHLSPLLYSYLSTRMLNIKIIFTEHSVWQYSEIGMKQKLLSNYLLWRSDAIVAISRQLYEYYDRKFISLQHKTRLILNGIDLNRYSWLKDNCAKEKIGFNNNDILIGIIANIRPEKNHKFLITAFSEICGRLDNSHLIIVGPDYMNGTIQQYASKTICADKIHFLGPRNDVVEILNALDVFCLPSIHEGLPLAILEAMACRVPVIGANVLGINEVVTDNENGLLFEPDDIATFVKMVMAIVQDYSLRNRLSNAGLEYVQKNFSLDNKIKEYERMFVQMSNNVS